ncbi:MAG: ABC transporter substrate-binding protein [Ardenticatenaceae bacterium]|nr:ABC transporter substrate-binding protein [Ardenticatenaceae bacterium]
MLLLLLVACSGQAPTETAATATSPAAPPTAGATDVPTAVPTTEPTAEPTAVPTVEIAAPTTNLTDGCVETYTEGVDYFPEKAEVTHSDGFTIEYFNSYKRLTVKSPYPGAAEVATYVLVQCGVPVPAGFEGAVIIEVPINSLVAMSTTYLPHLPTLDAVDSLVGLDSLAFASTPEIRARIDAGQVAEVGFGAQVNVEQVLDLDPDVVMTYASGSADFDAQPKLEEAGVTVVVNSDYLDASPLGQAEWVKFLAAFYNQEAAATTWFDGVVGEYEELAALAATAVTQPTVLLNTPYEGTWYMAGGQSYIAQLLADAGAAYLWADDPSDTTLFLDFETVFDKAQAADYWINLGFVASLADLEATDSRFAEFAAFQNGNVYNNDARVNESGGNDYYEGGAAHPHWVLADLIKIFHPELLPEHEFVYYRLLK